MYGERALADSRNTLGVRLLATLSWERVLAPDRRCREIEDAGWDSQGLDMLSKCYRELEFEILLRSCAG